MSNTVGQFLLDRRQFLAVVPMVASRALAPAGPLEGVTETGQRTTPDLMMRDKVVALQFVFTSCTTMCPLLGQLFAHVQRSLDPHVRPAVLLLSVSVDPETDTPSRLRRFLSDHGAQPGWHALRLPRPALARFLAAVGEDASTPMAHSAQTIVLDRTRAEVARFRELATPAEVTAAIAKAHRG